MEVSLARRVWRVERAMHGLPRGVLLDFRLENLHTLLQPGTEPLRWRMNRYSLGPECHLHVIMAAIDPHSILQPRPRQTRPRVSLGMEKNQHLPRKKQQPQHEAFILSNLRRPFG